MTGTRPPTHYGGLANTTATPPEAYFGVTSPEDAAQTPKYEKANENLRKPYPLPKYKPPGVTPLI